MKKLLYLMMLALGTLQISTIFCARKQETRITIEEEAADRELRDKAAMLQKIPEFKALQEQIQVAQRPSQLAQLVEFTGKQYKVKKVEPESGPEAQVEADLELARNLPDALTGIVADYLKNPFTKQQINLANVRLIKALKSEKLNLDTDALYNEIEASLLDGANLILPDKYMQKVEDFIKDPTWVSKHPLLAKAFKIKPATDKLKNAIFSTKISEQAQIKEIEAAINAGADINMNLYYAGNEQNWDKVSLESFLYDIQTGRSDEVKWYLSPLGILLNDGHYETAKSLIENGADYLNIITFNEMNILEWQIYLLDEMNKGYTIHEKQGIDKKKVEEFIDWLRKKGMKTKKEAKEELPKKEKKEEKEEKTPSFETEQDELARAIALSEQEAEEADLARAISMSETRPETTQDPNTILFNALQNPKLTEDQKIKEIEKALKAGADINEVSSDVTPLEIALLDIKNGNIQLAMLLIKNRADATLLSEDTYRWTKKTFLKQFINTLDQSPQSKNIKKNIEYFMNDFLPNYGFNDEEEPTELKEEKKEPAITEDEIALMQATGSTIEEVRAMPLIERQNLLNALLSSITPEEVKTLTPEEEEARDLSEALAASLK